MDIIESCFLRGSSRYRLSELTSDNPEAGGFNYRTATFGLGGECPDLRLYAEFQFEDTASDASNLGAWRRLGLLEVGFHLPLWWQIYTELSLRAGIGRSAIQYGGGYIPIPDSEMIAGLHLGVGVTIPVHENAALAVGVAGDSLASPRGYFDNGGGLFLNYIYRFEKESSEDPCFRGLQNLRQNYENDKLLAWKRREEVVGLLNQYQELKGFLPDLMQFQNKLYPDVAAWCDPEPPSLLPFELSEEVAPMPDYLPALQCETEKKTIRDAHREMRAYMDYLSDRKKKLEEGVATLEGKMDALFAWSLTCHDFKKPSRYLWFPNDNPDISLDPQWRDDVHGGKIQLFSNAQLDEVLLFLARNPEYNVGITTFANLRGKADRNDKLARARLNSVLQYLTLQGCRHQENYKDDQGPYCLYEPVNDHKYKEVGKEGEKENPRYIGGAYLSPRELEDQEKTKRFILPEERIAWAKAYSPDEVKNNPEIAKKVKIKLPDGAWIANPKSPLFRVAVFTFVKRETNENK